MPTNNNPQIKGKQALWGVGNLYTGIVTGARHKTGGDVDLLLDNNGFVIGKIYFNDNDEGEVDLIMETSTSIPNRGDAMTFAGIATWLVDETEIMWEQKGWQKLKIKFTSYVNLALS